MPVRMTVVKGWHRTFWKGRVWTKLVSFRRTGGRIEYSNEYRLDVWQDRTKERTYFPKGGWVYQVRSVTWNWFPIRVEFEGRRPTAAKARHAAEVQVRKTFAAY